MQLSLKHTHEIIPFPYFLVNREFTILQTSEKTFASFGNVENFLHAVDLGSREKAKRFILDVPSISKIELNMVTKENPFSLYDVFVHYEGDDLIHLFCIDKQEQIGQMKEVDMEIETNLRDINFSLLEKKNLLEKSLREMQEIAMKHDNLATVGKLAASVAHEIRNPLTSVRGFVQLLRPHLIDIGKEMYADIALQEIDRANDIIYEFLNASKPAPPALEEASLFRILEEVVLLSQSEALLNNCDIRFVKTSVDSHVRVDKKQLKQVILNLIKNAMEAVAESKNKGSGLISIEMKILANSVEVYVTDNGSGIEEDKIEKLFTPFFTTKEKGTGIGLAVCARIIKEHGGEITVDSEIGVGTTFVIRLPQLGHSGCVDSEVSDTSVAERLSSGEKSSMEFGSESEDAS